MQKMTDVKLVLLKNTSEKKLTLCKQIIDS